MTRKVDLPALQAQAASMARVAQERSAAYDRAIEAQIAFINDDSLKGAAYDKSKAYAENRLLPYLRGAKLLVEKLAEVSQQLVDKYISEVGNESLDEAVLEAQVTALNGFVQAKTNAYNTLAKADKISPLTLETLSDLIDTAKAQAKEAQEKLNKLRAFFATSGSILEGIAELQAAVQQGEAQTGLDYSQGNSLPDVRGLAQAQWVQTIHKNLQNKELEVAYQKALAKAREGRTLSFGDIQNISDYAQLHPTASFPSELKKLMSEEQFQALKEIYGQDLKLQQATEFIIYLRGQKVDELAERAKQGDVKALDALADLVTAKGQAVHQRSQAQIDKDNQEAWEMTKKGLKDMAGEFSNLYDLNRLITGIDPVTGQEANRWEAAMWLGLNFVPISKASKVTKAGKVADKLDDVADVAKAADKASDITKTADKLDDLADAGKVAEKAGTKNIDDILASKPKNSPNPEKWLDKGGEIEILEDGTWVYTNSDGVAVKYTNGFPDFKNAIPPQVKKEFVIDGGFEGRAKDFSRAGDAGLGNTWHHHQDGKTLQSVDSAVHRQFTHRGGISIMKGGKKKWK